MNDLVAQNEENRPAAGGPLARMMSSSINAGAVTIETERAVAEARGQIQLAKMFPRSVTAATTEFMDACKSPEFASTMFYTVPNRGSGPSIRFAEEAARCYGNFEYGHRELSRVNGTKDVAGKSEVEVYAWDKEKNNYNRRQIPVMHCVDTKYGVKILTDQTDIDGRIANVASKQMRGRILALLPKHMVAAGITQGKRTLAGDNEKPLSSRVIAMAQAFSKFGVTNIHLTKHLGHSVDDTTIDELADLIGMHNAIRDGAKASEYFDIEEKSDDASKITEQARKGATSKKAETKAEVNAVNQKSNSTESDGKAAKDSKPAKDHKAVTETPHSPKAEPEKGSVTNNNQTDENPPADTPQSGDDVF